jgi:hypothetical protein
MKEYLPTICSVIKVGRLADPFSNLLLPVHVAAAEFNLFGKDKEINSWGFFP